MTKVTAKTNSNNIRRLIGEVTTNRDKLITSVHAAAVAIMCHAAPAGAHDDALGYGDCTLLVELIDAVPNSWKPQVQAWFTAFSPIRYNKSKGAGYAVMVTNADGKKVEYKKLSNEDKLTHWNVADAIATPFNELTKEAAVVQPKDYGFLLNMVRSTLPKRIKTMIENGDIKASDVASAERLAEHLELYSLERVKDEPPANDDNDTTERSDVPEEKVA